MSYEIQGYVGAPIEDIKLLASYGEIQGYVGTPIEDIKFSSMSAEVLGYIGAPIETDMLSTSYGEITGFIGAPIEEITLKLPFEISGYIGVPIEEIILEFYSLALELQKYVKITQLCVMAESVKAFSGKGEPDYHKCTTIFISGYLIEYLKQKMSSQEST
ncbi:MAG: hypothetical protein DRO40_08655 [Thermoprotei archaeon]|nr:MAG: hypothetical protein DRO40_08655 [Thermoprotei archaeon]